jgi:hypothetical protein
MVFQRQFNSGGAIGLVLYDIDDGAGGKAKVSLLGCDYFNNIHFLIQHYQANL